MHQSLDGLPGCHCCRSLNWKNENIETSCRAWKATVNIKGAFTSLNQPSELSAQKVRGTVRSWCHLRRDKRWRLLCGSILFPTRHKHMWAFANMLTIRVRGKHVIFKHNCLRHWVSITNDTRKPKLKVFPMKVIDDGESLSMTLLNNINRTQEATLHHRQDGNWEKELLIHLQVRQEPELDQIFPPSLNPSH